MIKDLHKYLNNSFKIENLMFLATDNQILYKRHGFIKNCKKIPNFVLK